MTEKRKLLHETLAKMIGEDFDPGELDKDIAEKAPARIEDYSRDMMFRLCTDYVGKKQFDEAMGQLEQKGFWVLPPPIPKPEPNPQPDPDNTIGTHHTQQETLDGYESNYQQLERLGQQNEPVELLLRRCLVLAFLMDREKDTISAKRSEFQRQITYEDVLKEVKKLREAIRSEDRMTSDISNYLDKCGVYNKKDVRSVSPYDNLMALKKELLPIDVPDLVELVKNTEKAKDSIRDKNILLFIGETGSGKTTSIKALLGYKMGKLKYKGMDWVTPVEKITDPVVKSMHSNPGCKSVTRYIVAAAAKKEVTTKDILLADSPGFGDTAGVEVEIANMLGVSEALKGCKSILPVIVISKDSWGPRGNGLKKLAQTIASLFKDFRDCKKSVSVIINRFDKDERAELKDKFKNVIDELNAAEKANDNFVNVLEHFKQLAEEEELINFDPLNDSPKSVVKELVERKPQKPAALFSEMNPPFKSIRTYQGELEKRVRFHLANRNPVMVKYFIDELQELNNVLNDEQILNQINTLKDLVQKTVQEVCNKIISTFNNKVFMLSLTKEDIEVYFREIISLERDSGFDKLLPDCKLVEKGFRNYRDSVMRISSELTQERTPEEEQEGKNVKSIEQLRVLVDSSRKDSEVNQASQSFEVWLKEKLERHRDNYNSQLREDEYQKAAEELSIFRRYTRYSLLWSENEKVQENLEVTEGALLRHVNSILQEGRNYLTHVTRTNCAVLDATLQRITKYQGLAGLQRPETAAQIEKKSKEFITEVRQASDTQFRNVMEIINKAKTESISNEVVSTFSDAFNKLKLFEEMSGIGEQAKRNLEQAKFSLQGYFESQKLILQRITDSIANNPQSLKNDVKNIEAALNGIDKLAEFGGQQTVQSAQVVKAATLRELEDSIKRLVNKMYNIPQLAVSNPKAEEIIKTMEETYELEQFFSKLSCFKGDSNIERLKKTNQRNEENLKASLNSVSTDLSQLTSKQVDYSRLSLQTIENALRFLNVVIMRSWVDQPREKARLAQLSARQGFKRFGEQANQLIAKFGKEFLENDEEKCRELWETTKKQAEVLKELTKADRFPQSKEQANFEQKSFDEFIEAIEETISQIGKKFEKLKKNKDSYPELIKLEAKLNVFRKRDAEVIEQRNFDDILLLKEKISKAAEELQGSRADKIRTALRYSRYEELDSHLSALQKESGAENEIYHSAVQAIRNHVTGLTNEMSQFINDISKKKEVEIDLDKLTEKYNVLDQIQRVTRLKEVSEIPNLKKRFEGVMEKSMKRLTDQLDNLVSDEEVASALRLQEQLEAMETSLPKEFQPKERPSAEKFGTKISEVLTSKDVLINSLTAANLQPLDQLSNFFNRNATDATPKLKNMRERWASRVKEIFDVLLQEMRTSKTQRQWNEKCTNIEKVIKVVKDKEQERKNFEKIKDESLKRLEKSASMMSDMVEKISSAGKLDFGLLRPALVHMREEDNFDLLHTLKQKTASLWEKILEDFTKQPLTPLTFISIAKEQIKDFTIKANEFETHLSDTLQTIRDKFKVFLRENLQKIVSRIKDLLLDSNKLSVANLQSSRRSVISALRPEENPIQKGLGELLQAVQESASTEFKSEIVDVTKEFENAYSEVAKLVVSSYIGWTRFIKLEQMFGEKRSQENVDEPFEEGSRLGPIVKDLQDIAAQKDSLPDAIAGPLKQLLKDAPIWSEITQKFNAQMKKCEDRIDNFGGDLESTDEKELDEELRLFRESLQRVESFGYAYSITTGRNINITESKKKADQQVKDCYQELKADIQNMDVSYEETSLRRINRRLIVIKIACRNNTELEKQNKEVTKILEAKVKTLVDSCNAALRTFQSHIESFSANQKSNKALQDSEVKQKQKEYEEKKLKEFKTKELNATNLIKSDPAQKEERQKEWDSEKASFETEIGTVKADIAKEINQRYSKSLEKEEKIVRDFLAQFTSELIRLRIIQSGIESPSAKEACQKGIFNAMNDFKKLGKRWFKPLAEELEKVGKNETNLILTEHPTIFTNFNANIFRDAVKNEGEDYIIKNIRNIDQKVRKQLKEMYKAYLQFFNTQTKQFSNDPTVGKLNNLKDLIKAKAGDVKERYEKKKMPESGCELIAYIFALWTIKRASVDDEDGVEFLYQPHPAQVIAIFLILGLCGGGLQSQLGNRLAEVLTGEGKSIVLAGLSSYLALAGFEVSCMCYSRLLSRRDYDEFSDLFMELGIQTKIMYGTFGEVIEKEYSSKEFDLRKAIEGILLRDEEFGSGKFVRFWGKFKQFIGITSPSRILLIDEVDVFFNKEFFGKFYAPSITIKDQCIINLATFAWNNRNSIKLKGLLESAEYKACIAKYPRLQNILESNATDIIGSVRNFKHQYIVHEGKIGYVLPEGISFQASYGWKTVFAYFHEKEKGSIILSADEFVNISVLGCELSYAELPRGFKHIMGVTGTLDILPQCQKDVLKQWYGIESYYLMPSVYGESKRKKLGAFVVDKKDHFAAITKAIQTNIDNGRPVVVFLPTIEVMTNYDHSTQFKALKGTGKTMTVSEKYDAGTIRDRVIRATREGNITLFTKAFGRGIDFVLGEKSVKEKGGLHVIQTFLSEEESEAVQIEGRTARQGQEGSYELIITDDDLKSVKQDQAQLNGMNPQEVADTLTQTRRAFFNTVYSKQVDAAIKCRESHEKATKILKCISKNENEAACKLVSELNYIPPVRDSNFRIAIGIDATGSMSAALGQVVNNMRACIERTYIILKEKNVVDGFEIQVSCYRNYNSSKEKILESSPFSSTAASILTFLKNVSVDGGMGNEAIEVFYNHCLHKEKDVNEIIVIGDAACNTDIEFEQKRRARGEAYWNSNGFKIPPPSTLVQQLINRNIKVHSFYIGISPASYFQQVSKNTGGDAKPYDYSHKDAAANLTDFIVEKILAAMGGKDLVTAYRIRFPRS